MAKRKWYRQVDPKNPMSKFDYYLGDRNVTLPADAVVSITYLEKLNMLRSILNGLATLTVMTQLSRQPGLLYAEFRATGIGCGYTLSVWESKTMTTFRNRGNHGRAMKYLSWIFFGGGAGAYFLSWLAKGRIPTYAEIPDIIHTHGKWYDNGKLVRAATQFRPEPPALPTAPPPPG
jgi:hypothetical protein